MQSGKKVAIKIEDCSQKKHILKLEAAILSKIQYYRHFCTFISCGKTSLVSHDAGNNKAKEFNFIVMELLGKNLAELRKSMPELKFSLSTSALLGKQMLKAIKTIHEQGYLHRDVKPVEVNFNISPTLL
jgi:tau tubulin kinase